MFSFQTNLRNPMLHVQRCHWVIHSIDVMIFRKTQRRKAAREQKECFNALSEGYFGLNSRSHVITWHLKKETFRMKQNLDKFQGIVLDLELLLVGILPETNGECYQEFEFIRERLCNSLNRLLIFKSTVFYMINLDLILTNMQLSKEFLRDYQVPILVEMCFLYLIFFQSFRDRNFD